MNRRNFISGIIASAAALVAAPFVKTEQKLQYTSYLIDEQNIILKPRKIGKTLFEREVNATPTYKFWQHRYNGRKFKIAEIEVSFWYHSDTDTIVAHRIDNQEEHGQLFFGAGKQQITEEEFQRWLKTWKG